MWKKRGAGNGTYTILSAIVSSQIPVDKIAVLRAEARLLWMSPAILVTTIIPPVLKPIQAIIPLPVT